MVQGFFILQKSGEFFAGKNILPASFWIQFFFEIWVKQRKFSTQKTKSLVLAMYFTCTWSHWFQPSSVIPPNKKYIFQLFSLHFCVGLKIFFN